MVRIESEIDLNLIIDDKTFVIPGDSRVTIEDDSIRVESLRRIRREQHQKAQHQLKHKLKEMKRSFRVNDDFDAAPEKEYMCLEEAYEDSSTEHEGDNEYQDLLHQTPASIMSKKQESFIPSKYRGCAEERQAVQKFAEQLLHERQRLAKEEVHSKQESTKNRAKEIELAREWVSSCRQQIEESITPLPPRSTDVDIVFDPEPDHAKQDIEVLFDNEPLCRKHTDVKVLFKNEPLHTKTKDVTVLF